MKPEMIETGEQQIINQEKDSILSNTIPKTCDSMETDRRVLLECLSGGMQSTVLTRLLKGQNPKSQGFDSINSNSYLSRVELKEIANLHKITYEPTSPRTYIFQLNTLYAS